MSGIPKSASKFVPSRLYTYEESLADGQEVDNASFLSDKGVGQGGMRYLYSNDFTRG